MNLLILLLFCLLLTVIAWIFFRDIFSPISVLCEIFTLCSFFALIGAKQWEIDIELNTVIYIVLQLFVSIIVAVLIKVSSSKSTTCEDITQCSIINVNKKHFRLLFLAVSAMSAIYIVTYLSVILSMPGASVSDKIFNFRQQSITTGVEIPTIVNYFSKVIYAFSYFVTYILLHDLQVSKKIGKKFKLKISYVLSIVYLLAVALLTGARAEIVYYGIFVVVVFELIANRLHKKEFSLKKIFKMAIVGLVALALFYFSAGLIGRSSSNFIGSISGYFGSSIIALDRYINDSLPSSSDVWGKESFFSIIHVLESLGIIEGESSVHLDYIYVNGVPFTNVYTAFRSYINDFGMIGSFIMQAIFVIFFEIYYMRCTTRCKQLGYINTKILIFGFISYGLYMHFYSNYLFALVISTHTLIQIALIYVFKRFVEKSKTVRPILN